MSELASPGQIVLRGLERARGGNALVCPVVGRLRGPLDRDRLQAAVDRVVQRHEALRTTLEVSRRKLRQVIHPPSGVAIRRVDGQGSSPAQAAAVAVADQMDPARSVFEAALVRLGSQDHVLCLSVHHAACDGWSGALIWGEVVDGYAGRVLRPVQWQFSDFARWQRALIDGAEGEAHRSFWVGELAGAAVVDLSTGDQPGPPARCSVRLSSAFDGLVALARAERVSAYCAALAVLDTLLVQTTGGRDLCVGSLFANRARPEVRDTVGFLANLALVRVQLPRVVSFRRLLRLRADGLARCLAHQVLPHHVLPAGLVDGHPDLVFQMLPNPHDERWLGSLRATSIPWTPRGVRFGLELTVVDLPAGTELIASFDSGRYPEPWVAGFLGRYADQVREVVEHPDRPIPCR